MARRPSLNMQLAQSCQQSLTAVPDPTISMSWTGAPVYHYDDQAHWEALMDLQDVVLASRLSGSFEDMAVEQAPSISSPGPEAFEDTLQGAELLLIVLHLAIATPILVFMALGWSYCRRRDRRHMVRKLRQAGVSSCLPTSPPEWALKT